MITLTFVIRWSIQAKRFLSKLPRQIARRIIGKVNSITAHPFHFLEHHHGSDFFKLRVGSYRLLVDVDLKLNVIAVRVLGHRRNIYKGNV